MYLGNTVYYVELSGEDLSRYSNKLNQLVYENVRIITILLYYFTKKVMSQ